MAKQRNTSTTDFDRDEPGDFRERSRAAFSQFGEEASTRIESMPLFALAGGLALGAIIASLLPQGEREAELLEPAGSKLAGAGRASIDRVRDASKAKVDELAGDKLREFFGYSASDNASA